MRNLVSVGTILRFAELERVVGSQWAWFGKYGDDLLAIILAMSIPPITPTRMRISSYHLIRITLPHISQCHWQRVPRCSQHHQHTNIISTTYSTTNSDDPSCRSRIITPLTCTIRPPSAIQIPLQLNGELRLKIPNVAASSSSQNSILPPGDSIQP